MGNETEQPGQSDEAIVEESDKKPEGPASKKQPVDGAAPENKDGRLGGMQPSPPPVIDFMGWSNNATPVPTTLLGSGGGMDSAGILRPIIPPFWYPGVQNLNQFNLTPIFQCPLLQTDPQQNAGPPQFCGHGLVAIPLIPMFGLGGMPSPSNIFPVMMPMNMGQPMTMDDQSAVPGRMIPGTLDRVPQGEAAGDTLGLEGPPWGGAQGAQRPNIELQRQVNRRFRVGFQLDLLLLLKLAVVVFVFNQDGSKDRLVILLFLAAIVYMYQTGALAPLLRWFSQSAQRAMMPPQQPEHVNIAAQGQPLGAPAMGGAIGGGLEQNEGGNRNQQGLNNNVQRPPPPDAGNWWGLFKEMQMLIVGFVTSLLPGYQHAE
ncbi:hypothetical protein KC19_7G082900 [Ceratodon purpureus]|uniref:Uncharacterized protein n=1 Tax=Ceratodon purpureus TaxID=3225 RepID=A0A8T0H641_CERPU|nr:hypothetical protein KC19_7G082900 [Ceratodon purpureus]KAG0566717.1 hypothetical protein KC19_7G082900 [Ceratodon purpureus]KAG0566718.1 hypothetical protein KC19_7G082900 [Ceratodon purpureus]KAG0566719.1 hypothetical protein KC19_7G082900 [Ceratodon purpureus]KAG0566720.1 hypothetical protein KC19_7G082900 [Ceratodon purpureus]